MKAAKCGHVYATFRQMWLVGRQKDAGFRHLFVLGRYRFWKLRDLERWEHGPNDPRPKVIFEAINCRRRRRAKVVEAYDGHTDQSAGVDIMIRFLVNRVPT